MYKHKLVDFVIHFMEEIDKEISEMKLSVNARARIVAEEFLKNVSCSRRLFWNVVLCQICLVPQFWRHRCLCFHVTCETPARANQHKESTANQRGEEAQTGDDTLRTRIGHFPVIMNVDDCIYWNICQSHVKANSQHEGGSLNTPWGYLWIQGKARMCCKRNGQFFFVFTIHLCGSVCLLPSKKNTSKISPFRKTVMWHLGANIEPELSAKKPPKLMYETDER